MAKRRWQRPPRIRWFLAAWGLFVLACAVPAINHTLFFGDANATPSSEPGVSGLIWGYVFVLGVLANPLGAGSETLYLASMALPNTFMLISPILAFRLPPRASVFLFAAWTGAAMTLHTLSWFPFAARAIEYGTLPGSVAWAASFACLTMAFRDGALLPFPPGALERRTGTAPGVTTGSEESRIWI